MRRSRAAARLPGGDDALRPHLLPVEADVAAAEGDEARERERERLERREVFARQDAPGWVRRVDDRLTATARV